MLNIHSQGTSLAPPTNQHHAALGTTLYSVHIQINSRATEQQHISTQGYNCAKQLLLLTLSLQTDRVPNVIY